MTSDLELINDVLNFWYNVSLTDVELHRTFLKKARVVECLMMIGSKNHCSMDLFINGYMPAIERATFYHDRLNIQEA